MRTSKLFSTFLLIVMVSLHQLCAQTITGQVTSKDDGMPIPGVSVMVKATNTGTITDMNGIYSIQVSSASDVLVFSFVGLITQEISVKGRTIINVILESDSQAMDEVLVVGYGIQMEQEYISATQAVSSSLQGKASGMQIRGMSRSSKMAQMCYYPADNFNTEGYSTIHENGFKEVSLSPLSTFSIDVDAASYSNIRRYINGGSLPPVDAVRIEEMINYFTYDYKQPLGDAPFSINTELASCPWNSENYLLHVGLQGKAMETENLPASNLVFLLDVSGSMNAPNKLPLLKASFGLLLDQLRPEDRVAIVVYAGNSGLVLPSTPGSDKQKIMESLNNLQAGGSTAGGAGLVLAYKVAEENFMEKGNNRIILATDGDFNIGSSSNAEMERLIEKEREKGINISVLGFGMGNYKDDKMEIIADKGNGNYAYIDNLQEAKKVLVNEFGGTLFTIAKDVKFQLEFNPAQVESYRLIGYENRLLNNEDFEDDKKDAGDMGAGHTVTALYEIIPTQKATEKSGLKYQERKLSKEALESNDLITLKLRYKEPDGFKSKLLEQVVKTNLVNVNSTSDNFRFSAAVAEFGMLLRDSEFKGASTYESAAAMAQQAKGKDAEGYRGEMYRLIQSAQLLKGTSAQK
jgi:Ca-activated chloride channel family protein